MESYKSRVDYTVSDNTKVTYSFPFQYLKKKFVKVDVTSTDNTVATLTYGVDYTVTDLSITLTAALEVGKTLTIYRETDTDSIVSWNDGSILLAADMSLSDVQMLHLQEEQEDYLKTHSIRTETTAYNETVFDASSNRIHNVADPIDAQDAVTKNYMESVQSGFVLQNTALKNETTKQASAATVSATNAKTSETNSKTSETNAATSAAAAKVSETNAKTSETNAHTSETNAKVSETNAHTSETNAKTSETKVLTSEQNAKTSETKVLTSETNARASETNAATSAAAAKVSETNAKTSETNAHTSETNAKSSETKAATSEAHAKASETKAATSEAHAKASETNAKTSETKVLTSEQNAKSSETKALTSEQNAKTSETKVLTSEKNAKTSETNAANSAKQAAESAGVFQSFKGATADTDGLGGKVPKPLAGQQEKFLKADGTWGDSVTPKTLWDGMHSYPVNYVPSDLSNAGWNQLGFCSIFYNQEVLYNQATTYGQLINIPADSGNESTQLWIGQPDANLFSRCGNGYNRVNDTPFKSLATTADVAQAEKVEGQGTNWIRYKSGLQLCWLDYINKEATWSFPVAFSSNPVVETTSLSDNVSGVTQITTTSCSHIGKGGKNMFAIGRWK